MQNSDPLIWLGFTVITVLSAAICIPYLLRKSDALTAWNVTLLGGIMFTGVGSLAVVWGKFHWVELQWFQPTPDVVNKYIVGTIAFYGTLLFSYYALAIPKRFSAKFLNKWPPFTFPFLISMLVLFGAVVVTSAFTRGVFFIGPALYNISHKALVFAVVFSFCYWYQNKRQLHMLLLFLGVFALAALDAMVVFVGRRLLLSIAVAPLICMYWLHWRYLSPRKNLIRLALAALIALSVAAFYGSFRHFSYWSGGSERNVSTTIDALRSASFTKAISAVTDDALFYFGQYCGHYSLLTIHLVDSGEIEVEPLNSLIFLAGYPVPRAIWSEKPNPLGIRIVNDILHMGYQTNWGLGIVANGYQEGGMPVIMLYAFLIVVGIRLIDDALVRNPSNVFLLGILCTSAPHFVTLIRGEPCVMAAEIGESFVFASALALAARFFFGTAPATSTLANARQCYPPSLAQLNRAGR